MPRGTRVPLCVTVALGIVGTRQVKAETAGHQVIRSRLPCYEFLYSCDKMASFSLPAAFFSLFFLSFFSFYISIYSFSLSLVMVVYVRGTGEGVTFKIMLGQF